MSKTAPVEKDARREATKATIYASSSGVPKRFIGILASSSWT